MLPAQALEAEGLGAFGAHGGDSAAAEARRFGILETALFSR